MKAIFVTEKEAREFINKNFGKDAILKDCEVSDSERFDIDEVPYQWGGYTFAYEVNNGEAYVGFMEEPGAVYSAVFCGVSELAFSLYEAREIADRMKDVAEDCNVAGVISIRSKGEGEIDTVEVGIFDDEEPEGAASDFVKAWKKLEIGAAIKEARSAQSISIRELAQLTGMSKNNIVRIEAGLYNYTIDNLVEILSALKMDLDIIP